MRKVPGSREFVLPPCCVGPTRMFVSLGEEVGGVVELETVIAVAGGPSAEGGASCCDELLREFLMLE